MHYFRIALKDEFNDALGNIKLHIEQQTEMQPDVRQKASSNVQSDSLVSDQHQQSTSVLERCVCIFAYNFETEMCSRCSDNRFIVQNVFYKYK